MSIKTTRSKLLSWPKGLCFSKIPHCFHLGIQLVPILLRWKVKIYRYLLSKCKKLKLSQHHCSKWSYTVASILTANYHNNLTIFADNVKFFFIFWREISKCHPFCLSPLTKSPVQKSQPKNLKHWASERARLLVLSFGAILSSTI